MAKPPLKQQSTLGKPSTGLKKVKDTPVASATYGQVTGYKAGKTSGAVKQGGKPAAPTSTFKFHDQTFSQNGNAFTRANGKAVGKAGTSIIQQALKARAAGGAAAKPGTTPAASAGTAGTAPVTATTLPAPEVFDPNGTESWNGASGLSKAAVSWLSAGADSSYLDDVNSAQRGYDTFDGDLNKQAAANLEARQTALRKLGYDQTTKSWSNDQTTQRAQSLEDMGYDYGARGLLHSSAYANQLQTAQQGFQDQADAIVKAGDQFDTSIRDQRSNAGAELADAKLAAIRQAVQRRAASAGAIS